MKRIFLLLVVLLLTSCQADITPPAEEGQDDVDAGLDTDLVTESSLMFVDEGLSQEERTGSDLSVVIAGSEETVFDYTTDRCEDENFPDIAPRAIRDANGLVQLTISHIKSYRMIGPDLNNLEMDCTGPVMVADEENDPARFNDGEWIGSLYTEDGQTIYAIIHSEFRGHEHQDTIPGLCPSDDYLTCLDTAFTMAISTDGGVSYHDILEPPNHLIATLPYQYNDEGVPSGFRQPSNVVKAEDGFYYLYANISDYPEDLADFPPQMVCAMRTKDLTDPSSWRFWDGEGFNGEFVNPYTEPVDENTPKCVPLPGAEASLGEGMNESITYSTALEKYIMVGVSYRTYITGYGFWYSLSDDLVHWSDREMLIELPLNNTAEDPANDVYYAYPSLIDPDSESLSFGTTDEDPYLYLTRFNFGYNSIDRDIVRFPVQVTPPVYPVPATWHFDDDSLEGWVVDTHITDFTVQSGSLTMQTTGDDPYFFSPPIKVPADEYQKIGIRMKVSQGESTQGQLFFITTKDPEYSEGKSIFFEVIADGEFHDYILDMSTLEEWDFVVTQLRLDPVFGEIKTIEIDSIGFIK